ncbi:MAG: pilus assembly protein, partial [Lentisphaeria bacterium]|nr:pilus assembly protein [Lentisphaeria bacterium]
MKIREKNCRRRLESPRGTVMLEFALIMPVLLMIGMFVIEILQYHDAQLMADHAAWRLARIAAVRTSGKDGKVTFPKWKSIGSEQVAVALLMSTATTGWSGKGNELLASKIAALFGGESSQTGKFAGTIIGQLGVASMLESFFTRQFSGSRSGRMLLQLGMAGERVIEKDVIE